MENQELPKNLTPEEIEKQTVSRKIKKRLNNMVNSWEIKILGNLSCEIAENNCFKTMLFSKRVVRALIDNSIMPSKIILEAD
jgi:hypothetical protein